MKRLAYEGANFFPIAVPLTWRKNSSLKRKSLRVRLISSKRRSSSSGRVTSGQALNALRTARMPPAISMLQAVHVHSEEESVYRDSKSADLGNEVVGIFNIARMGDG